MTRLEENNMIIDKMTEEAERKPTGTYNEMVTFQLGAIATMLADISKSLVVVADKIESDLQRGEEFDEIESMERGREKKVVKCKDCAYLKGRDRYCSVLQTNFIPENFACNKGEKK